MKKNTPILDACCGGKMFYFDKEDPRVLFQDIREIETTLCDGRHFEVKPDVLGDFRSMKFSDGSFSLVVFDPPHLKYTGSKAELNGWQMTKYGHLDGDWRDTLAKGFFGMFPCAQRRRIPYLQVERDGHPCEQDTGTNGPQAYPWSSRWQTKQDPLDIIYEVEQSNNTTI